MYKLNHDFTTSKEQKQHFGHYRSLTSIAAGGSANIIAIPLSVIFVQVVKAASIEIPLTFSFIKNLYANMFKNLYHHPETVFRGGLARTGQKITTTLTNDALSYYIDIPKNSSELEKLGLMMLRSGASGLICSPISNIFKILQTNKIDGKDYFKTVQRVSSHPNKYKYLITNTMPFGAQEFLRCSIFFGVNQFIREKMKIYERESIYEKFMICLFSATITATFESMVGMILEPPIILHSTKNEKPPEKFGREYLNYYGKLFKDTKLNTPKRIIPVYGVLMLKNFTANLMFTCADTTGKQMEFNAKKNKL
ncbi:MAG: hypothetical protein V4496_02570 [Pseudomonadota bacterium]